MIQEVEELHSGKPGGGGGGGRVKKKLSGKSCSNLAQECSWQRKEDDEENDEEAESCSELKLWQIVQAGAEETAIEKNNPRYMLFKSKKQQL